MDSAVKKKDLVVIKMIDFVYMEGEQMNTKINQLLEYALKN